MPGFTSSQATERPIYPPFDAPEVPLSEDSERDPYEPTGGKEIRRGSFP